MCCGRAARSAPCADAADASAAVGGKFAGGFAEDADVAFAGDDQAEGETQEGGFARAPVGAEEGGDFAGATVEGNVGGVAWTSPKLRATW